MSGSEQDGTALDRRKAVRALLGEPADALIVTGLGSPAYDLFSVGDRPENFYLWGAMGGAFMIGLGLALAQPDRTVVVLTGDGEALMGIGSLMTIAIRQPANLALLVLDNGRFGETGMQRSHAGLGVDLARMAQASGIGRVVTVAREEELPNLRAQIHARTNGTLLARIVIAPTDHARLLPPRDGVHLKNRLRASLGLGVN